MITYPAYKVAAMHVAPVFLDAEATVQKACSLIAEAARNGARLVAFPEAYLPAFPVWCALQAPLYNHEFFRRLAANSIKVNGPEMGQVCAAARRHGVIVSFGFNEGSDASVGCLWNANVLIDETGRVINHHRKLVPTFWEKLVWATGDGAGLRVSDTSLGRIGMLICGENTNPLARFAMMAQGEQVHISSFPPVWPAHDPREAGAYDVSEAIRIRVRNHAFEGKLFNIVASGYMDRAMFDGLTRGEPDLARILEGSPRGISLIVGPMGAIISDVLQDEEGILYAEIDLAETVAPRQLQDVAGYYNRFDVFRLSVNRAPNRPVWFEGEELRPAPRIDVAGIDEDEAARVASAG
ncbi:carbon-nitrogen hydrolase family protein [Pelomicrobium methylotrophicum]|uniref:Carbon-nitrogen hydrolase family protein n=1 Tax=Pelomicrobium methylotrophicum TaxID=2602750 RepID=A0A5C7EDU1_9PROT|nr:carbon-nitrogen hydrolase family protein [Pelomicrobium methylotrophicum]TXF10042.1 carbon-nitrogen hydrolase family protein [Pelomicrobium methylotrophicum]